MVRKKKVKQGPGTAPSDSTGAPMVPNGLPHGGRQALEQFNAGTRPARRDGGATAASAAIGGGGPIPTGGVMGPTRRPGEPITAGVDVGPGPGPSGSVNDADPYALLRAMYRARPTPDLARILLRLDG